MRGLLLLILLLPSLAQADDAELAARAQAVHEERCASIKRGSGALAAEAMVEVAQVWGALEQASSTSAEPYVNYWSGLLAQCLNREDDAARYLRLFVGQVGESSAYDSMVGDASRRLQMLGQSLDADDRTPEALLKAAQEQLEGRCDAGTSLAARDVEELSATWAALGRVVDASRPLRFARGRLALCLGQQEHGVQELTELAQAPPTEEEPRPRALEVQRVLEEYDVHLGPDGAPLPDERVARRAYFKKRGRAEFWVAGGIGVGGTHTETSVYTGANVQDLGFGPWWSTGGEAVSNSGLVTWGQAVPTAGATPEVSFGLRGWTRHRPLSGAPLFGVGFFAGVRRETHEARSWIGDPDLSCQTRDDNGNCTQSTLRGFRMSSDPTVLLAADGARLVVGPEFSWRLLPEQTVSPAIHVVAPAFDLPLGGVTSVCSQREVDGGSPSLPETWDDVRTSAPVDEDPSTLWSPNAQEAGGWTGLNPDSDVACHAIGPHTAFPTVRVGVSLSARPTPFLHLGARVDVEPILTADALGNDNPLPEDPHAENFAPIRDALAPAVPILVVLQGLASVAF